jgi:hypothetical protein
MFLPLRKGKPRKLDRKRSKRFRSALKAKNRRRRAQINPN